MSDLQTPERRGIFERLADRDDIWEQIGTGGWTGVNELLFGLPEWLVKKTNTEAYQDLQRLREENPLAANIGTGAGMLGGMLVPVGAAAKVAGKGLRGAAGLARGARAVDTLADTGRLSARLARAAQSADRASDVLRNTRGLRGALLRGASQAVPYAAFNSEDPGEFLRTAALGTGLGAGAERLLGRVGARIGSDIDAERITPRLREMIQRSSPAVLGGAIGSQSAEDPITGALTGVAIGAGARGAAGLLGKGAAKVGSALASDAAPRIANRVLSRGTSAISANASNAAERAIAEQGGNENRIDTQEEKAEAVEAGVPVDNPPVEPMVEVAEDQNRRQLDSRWNRQVFNALQRKYFADNIEETGVSLKDYILSEFYNTNGFDPYDTAYVLWPSGDRAEKFIATLDARKFYEQQIDWDRIDGYNPITQRLGGLAPEQKLRSSEITAILNNLQTTYAAATGRTEDKLITESAGELEDILRSPAYNLEQKKEAIRRAYKGVGLDFDRLQSMGI